MSAIKLLSKIIILPKKINSLIKPLSKKTTLLSLTSTKNSINLLPWRLRWEYEKKREFILYFSACFFFIFFICLIVHINLSEKLSVELVNQRYLNAEIHQIDFSVQQINEIKKQRADLINRLLVLHQLQTIHVEFPAMFYHFSKILPNEIYLTQIKKEDDIITFTGKASSQENVAELIKNIEHSKTYSDPVLSEIQDTLIKNTLKPFNQLSFKISFRNRITLKPYQKNQPFLSKNKASSLLPFKS